MPVTIPAAEDKEFKSAKCQKSIFFGITCGSRQPPKNLAEAASGLLALKSDHIETLQIDEASQVPTYVVIALGVWCPKAWFALIGDVKQLELQEISISLPSTESSKDRSDPLVRRCPFSFPLKKSE
ncbi:hypothetical protein B9Z55_003043 [Caenorhabditis nigoni]|uniref:Uncharacterized protein n=1 Tax=Caenorhabditis nigoni TaxID=1611254 RepID=A0A2G5VN66_9PELO|nr:hypothetical protein B9Z55_003043 [Caenorhabditis nigoni]